MNKSDSERLATVLEHMGMSATDTAEDADVVFMNSCSVRQTAEDRVLGLSRNFEALKKKKPDMIVCVTGCMPGRDTDGRLGAKLHGVDLYFPTKDMVHLPERLASLNPKFRSMEDTEADYLALRPTYKKTFQSYVTIQTGCNHFCTYCVVPFARGLEVNRPIKDILDEVRDRAVHGSVEITLLGQIVNHYVAPDPEHISAGNPYVKNDFAKLLWEVNAIPGIERIHWTAPHPIYMDDEVIDALAVLPKQANFLHLPVQSGNDDMLKRMNRRHDRNFYIELVKKIRAKKPDIAIGTDIIVGFSGETEEQFADTVDLYQACDFDIAYTAQYSERSGTVAAKAFEDTVPKEEKKRRWQVLQHRMEEIVLRKNQFYLGKIVRVLVDSCDRGWCSGNSDEMKRVRFRGTPETVGTFVSVRVQKAQEWLLWGEAI